MGTAVKTEWLKSQTDRPVYALSLPHADEMKRLFELYDKAVERADIDQARHLRVAISDLVDQCCGDRAQREELRGLLGFSVGGSSTVLDQ